MTRRDLLKTTMLSAAACLLPGAALALRIEDDNAVMQQLYLSACERQGAHAHLVRELIAKLEGSESHEQAVAEVRAMSCPICGCKLAPAVDAGNPS